VVAERTRDDREQADVRTRLPDLIEHDFRGSFAAGLIVPAQASARSFAAFRRASTSRSTTVRLPETYSSKIRAISDRPSLTR